jgi:riboflavin kinase/FMN adenylyltransferase
LQVVAGRAALERRLVRPVVTVGSFDGIHVGHRSILSTVVARAHAHGGTATVVTFDPHPRKVLSPDRAPLLLSTTEQRLEQIAEAGIDVTILEPFTAGFARTSPEEFVREYLHAGLAPVEVYVGYDFRFGKDREGSMRMLTELGPRLGFAVTIIPEVTIDGEDVNSTRIRELVQEGDMAKVDRLLGRPYAVRGCVGRGDRRGRTLGFPTLNLEPENELLPATGVYEGRVRFLDDGHPPAGSQFVAVSNVGRRPTFDAGERVVCESHLLDFDADAYDRRIEVAFHSRLRTEQRFADVEALRTQIAADVEETRRRSSAP